MKQIETNNKMTSSDGVDTFVMPRPPVVIKATKRCSDGRMAAHYHTWDDSLNEAENHEMAKDGLLEKLRDQDPKGNHG